jgi:hypothetical protein
MYDHESEPASDVDGDGILHCPCGGNNTHHGRVVVAVRDREDSDGTFVAIEPGGDDASRHLQPVVTMRRAPSADIVCRRGSIEIAFSCEQCGADRYLEIIQHKGQTFLRWLPL